MSGPGSSDLRYLNAVLALLEGERATLEPALRALEADAFAEWCLRQQIGGFVYLLLEEVAPELATPRAPAQRLRGAYLEQWARAERLRMGVAELADILDRAGEAFLVLKGLPFAERYYGGYDRRSTGDLDVWVPRPRAATVAAMLERSGLTRLSPRWDEGSPSLEHVHQVELEMGGIHVELHHALRVHKSFRIDADELWRARGGVEIHGRSYPVLADEHALLMQLLGLHTDVQIGQVNARWFVDLDRLLDRLGPEHSWDAFFAARERDATRRICVNALALFMVLVRGDHRFPSLSRALAERRGDIVLEPDRMAYLELLRAGSTLGRKTWPLRQYEDGTASAVAWWLQGMPRRIAAKPDAFARDVGRGTATGAPWETTAADRRRSTVENEFGVDPDTLQDVHLRFGSLRVLLRYSSADLRAAVEELYRLRPFGAADGGAGDGEGVDLVLHLFRRDPGELALLRLPDRPVVERPLEGLVEIHDGIAHLWVEEGSPRQAWLAIDQAAETRPLLLHSLMVTLNRMLARDGRYHLHAAAVAAAGGAALFVGGKGSGKTTISLTLGRAGATVLSEDHVMLRSEGRRFLVSGCDGKMHLTETSERHFFEQPVEGRAVESAGVRKKQVEMKALFDCRPWVEAEVGSLFFPRVGRRFEIAPLAREEAAARLLEPLLERHRFAGEDDRGELLAVLGRLVESCECFELELSPDLGELSRLVDFLEQRGRGRGEGSGAQVAATASTAPRRAAVVPSGRLAESGD